MKKPLPVIIPLGNGSRCGNGELRILLRSIEKNVTCECQPILVTCDCPSWVDRISVDVIPIQDKARDCKDENLIDKTLGAIEWCGLDEFAWCADDNVFIRAVDLRKYPVLYVGERDFTNAGARWVERVLHTREFFGIDCDYESHAPQYFGDAKAVVDGMSRIPWRGMRPGLTVMTALRVSAGSARENALPRVICHESAETARDARFCSFYGMTMSYTDDAFIKGGLRDVLFRMFPNKSRWEK